MWRYFEQGTREAGGDDVIVTEFLAVVLDISFWEDGIGAHLWSVQMVR